MVPYAPPVSDMRFVLEDVAGLASIAALPGYEVATPDTVAAVLDQAADLARDVLAPLNAAATARVRGWRTAWCARPPAFATPTGRSPPAAGSACPAPEHGGRACR